MSLFKLFSGFTVAVTIVFMVSISSNLLISGVKVQKVESSAPSLFFAIMRSATPFVGFPS